MLDSDFDLSGDEWFDEEVARWNTERKRQYLDSTKFSDDSKPPKFNNTI